MELKVFFYLIRWLKKSCIIFGCICKYKYGLVTCSNPIKPKGRVWSIISPWVTSPVPIESVFSSSRIPIPSISLSRVDRTLSCTPRCDVPSDRLPMMESISSRKMRAGAPARALWKTCHRYKNTFVLHNWSNLLVPSALQVSYCIQEYTPIFTCFNLTNLTLIVSGLI